MNAADLGTPDPSGWGGCQSDKLIDIHLSKIFQ